jgi:acyl-CoA synthetase (NDP forming)
MACVRALGGLKFYGEFLRRRQKAASATGTANSDPGAAKRALAGGGSVLTERLSRDVLAAYGLPRLPGGLATTAEEAATLAERYGPPVVLKIESPDIAHKTEAGGVRIGLSGAAAVRAAFDEIMASAAAYKPGAALNGVLVQPVAPAGLDMIIGLINDPTFGPVIVTGIGGIHVEVMRDLAYRVAPVDEDDARAMLRELRAYRLLEGVRGAKARDIDALVDAIVRVSWLGHDLQDEIAELDINPIRVGSVGEGVWLLDALISKAAKADEEPHG